MAQLRIEMPDHPEIEKADLDARQDEQVRRVEVGVKKAVLIEHADDRLGAEIDQALALVERHQGHARSTSGRITVEELHARARCRPRTRGRSAGRPHPACRQKLSAKVSAFSASQRHLDLAQGVLAEFVDHPSRLVSRNDQLQKPCGGPQQRGVAVEEIANIRLDDLEDHLFARSPAAPSGSERSTPSRAAPHRPRQRSRRSVCRDRPRRSRESFRRRPAGDRREDCAARRSRHPGGCPGAGSGSDRA